MTASPNTIYAIELIAALAIAVFFFVWVRPSPARLAAMGAAGVAGALYAWVASIYVCRWGWWSYLDDNVNLLAGGYTIDLMSVPLLVPLASAAWVIVFALLIELPSATAEGGPLHSLSPATWIGLLIGVGGLLGAMATTLNAGIEAGITSGIGSLTFFAALPWWLLLFGVGVGFYANVLALVAPGRSVLDRG